MCLMYFLSYLRPASRHLIFHIITLGAGKERSKINKEIAYENTSQVAHQAGAYPGFCSTKWLGVFLLPFGRILWSSIKFAGTQLYNLVERGTVRVRCLALKKTTQCPRQSHR